MVNTSQQWYCQEWTYLTLVAHHSHYLRLYHDHRVYSPGPFLRVYRLTHSHLPNRRVRERERC